MGISVPTSKHDICRIIIYSIFVAQGMYDEGLVRKKVDQIIYSNKKIHLELLFSKRSLHKKHEKCLFWGISG